MLFDTNKVVLTGIIDKLESTKTKQMKTALNMLLLSENKYQDLNQCQAYGELADLIRDEYPVGTSVIIIGRLRSVGRDQGKLSNWVVIEKIGKELTPKENDGFSGESERS